MDGPLGHASPRRVRVGALTPVDARAVRTDTLAVRLGQRGRHVP